MVGRLSTDPYLSLLLLYFRIGFGYLLPAYQSFKAIQMKDFKKLTRFLVFWIVIGLISAVEDVLEVFVSWYVLLSLSLSLSYWLLLLLAACCLMLLLQEVISPGVAINSMLTLETRHCQPFFNRSSHFFLSLSLSCSCCCCCCCPHPPTVNYA